jgi:hypothetical protein
LFVGYKIDNIKTTSTTTTTTTTKHLNAANKMRNQNAVIITISKRSSNRPYHRSMRRLIHLVVTLILLILTISVRVVFSEEIEQDISTEHHDDESSSTTTTTTSSSTTTNDGTIQTDDAESPQNHNHQQYAEDRRVWGSASRDQQHHQQHGTTTTSTSTSALESSASGGSTKIPFVSKTGGKTTTTTTTQSVGYQDPFSKGFQITARVYTDTHDKLAHFDNNFHDEKSLSPIVLPYWECGVTGSTTVPVPLQHVTVRHLLGGSKPNSFSVGGDDDFGPHPQLVVPLTPVEIVLNSGTVQTFGPGDVVLLENVIAGGHKLQGHEKQDMICMLLTLPHPYYHIGKEKNSLQTIFEKTFWKQNPCKTGLSPTTPDSSSGESCDGSSTSMQERDVRSSVLARWAGPPHAMRRVGLGVIGAGLSLAVADFLGKCAPFILAVAFGGGALVIGGTYGIIRLGEYGVDELEIWHERRLLRLQGGSTSDSSVDDDETRGENEKIEQMIEGTT